MKHPGPPHATAPLVALLLLIGLILAGCMSPPAPSDDPPAHVPPKTEIPWSNPYDFPLHFDGWRAYADLLAHIYEDPANHTGPRYRIPGTETHAAAAQELLDWLREPVERMGGTVAFHNLTGSEYYELDLTPIAPHLCSAENPARDHVRGLTFSNVVGRTHPDEIGLIVAAHWDSKSHVEVVLERTHVEPAYMDPEHPEFVAGIHDVERAVLGADDGASGTVAVIELARAFAKTGVDLPLTFILFDGEDGFDRDDCHPLAGSLHYAQSLSEAERNSTLGLVLLDMVGNHTARYYREGYSQCYTIETPCDVNSRWLVDHVWGTAAAMGVGAFVNSTGGTLVDDHVAFLHEGLHAIDIIRYENRFPRYWHTSLDDHTAVRPMGLHQVGQVVEASIRLLATQNG